MKIKSPAKSGSTSAAPGSSGISVQEPVNIYAAKTQLSRLVDQAAAGDDVVLSRHGKPLVRITTLAPAPQVIRFGLLKGRMRIPADFDSPLPAAIQAEFEGR